MLEKWDIAIPELTGDALRSVYVYIPDSCQEDPERRYPVLYMFDGHNVFYDEDATYGKSWGMLDYMDRTGTEMIIAAVECNHSPDGGRLSEYSPFTFSDPKLGHITGRGKTTMDWWVNTFKPLIDSHYPTLPDRRHTFIAGSSMGGLMAYYTVVAHNDVFSKAACISSAVGFCYNAMREELTSAGPMLPDTRVYMSWGSKESGRKPGLVKYTCTNLEFSHLLVERGAVTYPYLQAFGGHCEADWEKQNAIYMPFLWNGVFEDGME